MYVNGTRFEVKLPIRHGDQVYEKGLKGTITGHVNKMIGKAYTVEFDDGRNAELHMVIINNQTEIETPEA